MPQLKFRSPEGKTITVESPDGSIPSEQELDQLFSMAGNSVSTQSVSATPPKKDLIDTMAGASPADLEKQGHWVAAGLQKTAKDVASVPAHFFNQLLMNYPRSLAARKGFAYPEAESGTGTVLSKAAGVVGGLKNPLLKALGVGSSANLLKEGAKGAILGATYAPTEDIVGVDQRKAGALAGAIGGAILPTISAASKFIPKATNRAGAFVSGIEPDVMKEVEQKGFRNVLQNKYFDKKMPEQIQERIETNLDKLQTAASDKYTELTKSLQNEPFDFNIIKEKLNPLVDKLKKNPFKGAAKDVNDNIVNGISEAKVNTVGDVLELRRNLDEVLYTAKGQGVKSEFGKKVRDAFNEVLHKNDLLKQADQEWYSLENAMREGKKVIGETGENFLKRFSSLTSKQKEMLSGLEKQIGGEPFIEDLTNWSLAQKFSTKASPLGSLQGLVSKVSRPALRGYLRTSELAGKPFTSAENALNNNPELLQKIRQALILSTINPTTNMEENTSR